MSPLLVYCISFLTGFATCLVIYWAKVCTLLAKHAYLDTIIKQGSEANKKVLVQYEIVLKMQNKLTELWNIPKGLNYDKKT